jgi:hypothetical protein
MKGNGPKREGEGPPNLWNQKTADVDSVSGLTHKGDLSSGVKPGLLHGGHRCGVASVSIAHRTLHPMTTKPGTMAGLESLRRRLPLIWPAGQDG